VVLNVASLRFESSGMGRRVKY